MSDDKDIPPRIKFIWGEQCSRCGSIERRSDNGQCVQCSLKRARQIAVDPQISSACRAKAWLMVSALSMDCDRRDERQAKNTVFRHHRRSARGHFTRADVKAILAAQDGHCAYCDARTNLHLDHAIPIARGGSNWPWNLQWLCARHNMSKNDKTDAEYRRAIGLPPGIWVSASIWSDALLLPIWLWA